MFEWKICEVINSNEILTYKPGYLFIYLFGIHTFRTDVGDNYEMRSVVCKLIAEANLGLVETTAFLDSLFC